MDFAVFVQKNLIITVPMDNGQTGRFFLVWLSLYKLPNCMREPITHD